MKVEEGVLLGKLTSLHVGGPAQYVIRVGSEEELIEAVAFAHQKSLPFFVLGKGSNTVFSDAGYKGVIIVMSNRQVVIEDDLITAGAGVFMRLLVTKALEKGVTGLEELAGIPGTVGGAVRGNAGTWQTEIKDVVQTVTVMQFAPDGTHRKIMMAPKECEFGYRHSIFKLHPHWVVLEAVFKGKKGDVKEGAKRVAKDLEQRHMKQPYDAPSAGSVFKNPDKANGIFSGKLVEEAGLKGLTVGGAQISEKHGNFIINKGSATATDVLTLVKKVQREVKEKFGHDLQPEIEIVE